MAFMQFLSYLNMTFVTFLLVEITLSFMFTKDWKFRFRRAKGYSQLRPHSKSWKILWVFLIFTFVLLPLLTTALWFFLPSIIERIGWLQLLILSTIFPLVYLWAKLKIIARKKICGWDSIPILISVGSAILFLILLLK